VESIVVLEDQALLYLLPWNFENFGFSGADKWARILLLEFRPELNLPGLGLNGCEAARQFGIVF
jgi:hypothetical protein